ICFRIWRRLLIDLAKGYANRLADFDKDLAGFVYNEHIAFYKSRALSISTLVPLHLGGITEAIGLKRMQDFDFADGELDKHFSKFFAKVRTYSCLHGSINKGGLQNHALEVFLPEFRQLQNPQDFIFVFVHFPHHLKTGTQTE